VHNKFSASFAVQLLVAWWLKHVELMLLDIAFTS